MSEANVAAARWAVAAFYGEDVEDARDLLHEDFELAEAPDVPDAARFSGENCSRI